MADNPLYFPDFAMQDQTDDEGRENVAAPDTSHENYGLVAGEYPSRQNYNFLFRRISQWLRYLYYGSSDTMMMSVQHSQSDQLVPVHYKIVGTELRLNLTTDLVNAANDRSLGGSLLLTLNDPPAAIARTTFAVQYFTASRMVVGSTNDVVSVWFRGDAAQFQLGFYGAGFGAVHDYTQEVTVRAFCGHVYIFND